MLNEVLQNFSLCRKKWRQVCIQKSVVTSPCYGRQLVGDILHICLLKKAAWQQAAIFTYRVLVLFTHSLPCFCHSLCFPFSLPNLLLVFGPERKHTNKKTTFHTLLVFIPPLFVTEKQTAEVWSSVCFCTDMGPWQFKVWLLFALHSWIFFNLFLGISGYKINLSEQNVI